MTRQRAPKGRAARASPHDPDAHTKLGEFLYTTGQRKEATAQFREARRLKAARFPNVHGPVTKEPGGAQL